MSNTYKSVNIPQDFENNSGPGGGNPPYSVSFNNTTSWSLGVDDYFITVPAGTHERGSNVLVQVFETNGDFELVDIFTTLTASGSVTIRVGLNSRFSGKLIITGE